MAYVLKIAILCIYFISLYFSIFWLITFQEKSSKIKAEQKKRDILSAYPFVSIIIPAYNEEETVQNTLSSVFNLEYPKDKYEIIIVDDGSTDTTSEKISEVLKTNTQVAVAFHKQKNQGKAVAMNWGLTQAKGEFFACLDADSFVESETLKKMILFYSQHEENLVIVTPSMKVIKPQNLLQKFQRLEYILAAFLQRLMGHIDCIYVAPGPFSLYRTEVIKKLGGFDEQNITEDQEIAYRVQLHQFKIKQCPLAFVKTVPPKKVHDFYKQRNRWFKGTLLNLIKYKSLFLNKKYGDFGFFQMPLNLCTFFLGIISIAFFSYFMLKPIYVFLSHLVLVDFNFMVLIRAFFSSTFDVLQLDLGILFFVYMSLLIALYFFYESHKISDEQMFEEGIFYLVPYLFLYYVFLSAISVIVLFETIVGKRQKW